MLSKVPDRRQAPVLLHFLALAIGAALLLPKLGTIPGLHGDEAWFGLQAHKIIGAGARPLGGMTPYTGPLYQYLLVPVLALGGYEVAALRSLGVAANLVAAHFYFLLVRRFFDPWTAALAVLTLVTTPFFQLEGRFALEVTALNPVLALGAGLLLARRRPASVFAAGLLLALGVWSHVIFLSVPLTIFVLAAFKLRSQLIRAPLVRFTVLGFSVGLLLALFAFLANTDYRGGLGGAMTQVLGFLLSRIADWPGIFLELLHGDTLFLRFTGEVALPTPEILPLLVVASAVWLGVRVFRGQDPHNVPMRVVLGGFAVLFSSTLLVSPFNSDRYFLLPLWVAPLFIGRLAAHAFDILKPPLVPAVVLASFVILQGVRVVRNEIVAGSWSGGKLGWFELGSMPETSNGFVRTDRLYEALVAIGAREVHAQFFIGLPLLFYDLGKSRLQITVPELVPRGKPVQMGREIRVVIYRDGWRLDREQFPELEVVWQNEHFFVLGKQSPGP